MTRVCREYHSDRFVLAAKTGHVGKGVGGYVLSNVCL